MLWATHLVDEVEYADRVAVLNEGHLLADEEPDRLIARTNASDLSEAFIALTDTKAESEEV